MDDDWMSGYVRHLEDQECGGFPTVYHQKRL